MENNKEHHIERTNFDAFVHAVGSEIEQAQVRLITAANAQMLFHYWCYEVSLIRMQGYLFQAYRMSRMKS